MVKVHLDTDIGNDIDDAVALAYLLMKPECDLVGITTVTEGSAMRAGICEVICQSVGKQDIPIHCGLERALANGPGQRKPPQFEAIKSLVGRSNWPENTAIEFMRDTIRSQPGEITLLTIGPLTNVAALFAAYPDVPALLKGMVSMAGAFDRRFDYSEWNIRCDPVAAAIVYASEIPGGHQSYGLDVTLACKMSASEVLDRFKGKPLETVALMAEIWFQHSSELTFHDPLAAAAIFDQTICELAATHVSIDPATGITRTIAGSTSQSIAVSVDAPSFFDEFFQTCVGS